MKTKTRVYDAARYLKDEADIAAYLNAALEEGDEALFRLVLDNVVRAQGVADIAKRAGVQRESLYKSLNGDTKPRFETITKILGAMNLDIRVQPSA